LFAAEVCVKTIAELCYTASAITPSGDGKATLTKSLQFWFSLEFIQELPAGSKPGLFTPLHQKLLEMRRRCEEACNVAAMKIFQVLSTDSTDDAWSNGLDALLPHMTPAIKKWVQTLTTVDALLAQPVQSDDLTAECILKAHVFAAQAYSMDADLLAQFGNKGEDVKKIKQVFVGHLVLFVEKLKVSIEDLSGNYDKYKCLCDW
jgi:hypothetical protein